MKLAQQVFSHQFDADFFKLPANIQRQVETKIDELGSRLDQYPHQRLKGSPACRLRVGDYRVGYTFDLQCSILYLVAVGNRREVYKRQLRG